LDDFIAREEIEMTVFLTSFLEDMWLFEIVSDVFRELLANFKIEMEWKL
jgi:hypothetical protein